MSHFHPGLMSAYNSLTDKHLAGYFSNTRIRRHLQRAGLITRSGRIVPDKEYRHKLIQRAHQRHVRECLAQAIFHKVLEMERVHQIEIKRKLEEFARRERVHKIKVERSKRYEEDIIRILSPRPPTGARGIRKQHSGPEGEHSESSESPGSSRPNTAPGKMQRPVRLKPIHSNSTTASLRRSSPYRLHESSNENDQPLNCTMNKASRRRLTTVEASHGISPYCLPVINNFVTPVPPATKRKERGVKVTPSSTLRGRRLRPTTASSGADVSEDPPMLRSTVHQSRVCVNMVYFGKTVHLSHDLSDMRDEVKVFQQHCGGENLCVYKGNLREGETFQFISRRHRGFPFSLTFFLNGLQVERLSSCCEFKHRKGSRLGGRHGHFGFINVDGASPCYKCIIAMGLDKKPTPPPKRIKEEDGGREESAISPKDAPEMETERAGEDAASHSECETSQAQTDMEAQVKEETAADEDKVRDDYEEDFEADDEGPAEDTEAKEKESPSPSGETERQVKERDASETEDDEKDEDINSRADSCSSGSDREESDAEATKDSREDEKAEQLREVGRSETDIPLDEQDEPNPEEAEPAVPKDSNIQNSAGDSTEVDVSDASVPSGNENKPSDDTSGDKESEKTIDESKQEEEPERAKSVQEKLAEAILKESQCSSEPELSDTSTEEEEESTKKGPGQEKQDADPEKSVTFTEQQQTLAEETNCEGGVGQAEMVVQDQEETSEPKEQEDETDQETRENSDSTKEEKVKIDEEDEKAAPEEDKNIAGDDESEDAAAVLHPVSAEETAEKVKTPEPQEDAEARSTEAAEKGEENEELAAVEADTQPDKTGQGAKSSEEDESSVLEPNKKIDETAVPDDEEAEAEAMTASEAMEMKAEPSEEQEALNCEEAPVTDAEKRQQGDSEDRAAASETTADTREDNTRDGRNKGDIKEEEAVEAGKVDNQHERCVMGEEQTEKSGETDDRVEERSDKQNKEEEKQTSPDEITEGQNSEESKVGDEDKADEDENNESKIEEKVENEENISAAIEEQAEKTHGEEDKVADEEEADESDKTEKHEDGERVENENGEEEPEEKGASPDKTNEGEKMSEIKEGKDKEAEKEEKEQNENEAEQGEVAKSKDEESEEKKAVADKTGEGEDISEIAEQVEKSADAASHEDVKTSDENLVESEDVGDIEAANAAHGTEDTLNDVLEPEDVTKEAERGNDNSEQGEIDAENGEVSVGAESKFYGEEEEAQAEGVNEVRTELTEDERKTEEPTEDESTEVKEVTAESGDGAEEHKDDDVGQAPEDDELESGTKEGHDSVEKQDESTKNDSEPETSGTEVREGSKSDETRASEEAKQDENISDHEKRDSDLTKRNDDVQSTVREVIVASSCHQGSSSTTMAGDLDDTACKLDESTAPPDSKTGAADLSAADGENGDTEEASKASEEGASVLLKPQAQSPQLMQQNEADNAGEIVAAPGTLAKEDNTDLVTNWVTLHQTSNFFETFVEPLEDLKGLPSDAHVYDSNKEATQSTEPPRSASPLKMAKMPESTEQERLPKDLNESWNRTKVEALESDLESSHPEDGEPCEKDPAKDMLQVQEETEVKDFIPKTESEQNDKESVNGQEMRSEEHSRWKGSLEEDEVQTHDNTEQTHISKTEVESITGTHHSVTSGRPESVSENQTEGKSTDNGPDLNEKETTIEEVKDLLPSTETEEHRDRSTSPEGLPKLRATEPNNTEETWEKSREVTEISDFTASRSEDGSQEESHLMEIQPKPSDASISGDRRDMIQDITRALSKDRLSTFSVDETLFGRSSYPLLAAARTESGH